MRTYGSLVFADGKWIIPRCEPHISIKLKAIFQKIPKTRTEFYEFPDLPEFARDLDWFVARYPLTMNDNDRAYLSLRTEQHIKKLDELEVLMRPDYKPRDLPLKLPLRHYQAQGCDLYLANQALLCGDDVGLGKTALAIGSFLDPRTLPACVVVQTHLPKQWKEQIAKFVDLRVHVIKTRKPYNLPEADVYVMKYGSISGWIDTFRMGIFKSAVFDEVQELRHHDTDKYRSARALSRSAAYRLGLSATPIYNKGIEIYNILEVLKEGALGNRDDFLREWGGEYISDPQALGTYLRENFLFLRRTRREVNMELPPINKIVHTVDHDQKAVDRVQAIAEKLAVTVMTGSFIERGMAARDLNLLVRQMTGVSKAKFVADYVRILLENGEPVVLGGWHREVYEIWLKELAEFKPAMYTGSESPAQKEASKQAFINGDTNLFILSLRSGVGLDGLQARGNIVVFGELDWSPAVHEQFTGRLDRFGQENQVTAIYLVSDEGSDPLMVDLLGLKASQAHGIINPLQAAAPVHTDESRIRLLAQKYLKKQQQPEVQLDLV